MTRLFPTIALLATLTHFAYGQSPDLVIADFEGATYGDWIVTGEAFGTGPAHGRISSQRHVAGFEGNGFASSYVGGDKAIGSLTSPPFKVERDYINFLIGGGNKPGRACINLLLGEKVVRTATGMNDETLTWNTWNVKELLGTTVKIQILDRAIDRWGHISIDSITQSEQPKIVAEETFHERYRPQFHFTSAKNWINDPNGLVLYEGEYHLFFQHNPKETSWGNMTWGHAISPDFFHWQRLPDAIEPDKLGTIFSGSAVVDRDNTSGFQTGDEKPIVCVYTSAGGTSEESKNQRFTQSIAYSNDRGRTWTKYEKNPILDHLVGGNRDPKVIWYEPSHQWIMALYLDKDDKHPTDKYALFGSKNLKEWTRLSDLPSVESGECPDLFELPLEGDPSVKKWIFWGGNGNYLIGAFDGKSFAKEAGPFRFEYGANYYAAQTYSGLPDLRRVQIAWMAGGKYPGMPFNQQMSLPSDLKLRKFPEGLRVCRQPVAEFDSLHGNHYERSGSMKEEENLLSDISGELLDICAELEVGNAESIRLTIHGTPIVYHVKEGMLSFHGKSAKLDPVSGALRLRVIVDRSSIELFGGDGKVTMSNCFLSPENDKSISIVAQGGEAKARSLDVWEVNSVWP